MEKQKRQLTEADQGWHAQRLKGIDPLGYLSASKIGKLLETPRSFERRYIKGIEPEETPAKKLGKVMHMAILEPDKYRSRVRVQPKFSGKGMKAAKAEWMADLPEDSIVLTQTDAERVLYMLESVHSHPFAMRLMKDGLREQIGYFFDPVLNVWFMMIADILKTTMVIEVKTTKSANPKSFSADIGKFNYYVQAAIYLRGVEILLGKKIDTLPVVCVENTEPYVTEVYFMTQETIEIGRQLRDRGAYLFNLHMDGYRQAIASGFQYFWPGYNEQYDKPEPIGLRKWKLYELEEMGGCHEGS